MRAAIFLIVILFSPAVAQDRFRMNDASKLVDVDIRIDNCPDGASSICGPLHVRFFRKGQGTPFQIITLPRTDSWDDPPKANVTRRYDDQSIINFGDFNFDGAEDVAICDGTNGGYGMPSYQVYLYSRRTGRFVRSASFTRLNQDGNLGMFEVDKRKKMLYRFTKSGCCWHQTEGYDVVADRPRKIYEFTEEVGPENPDIVVITTRKLIKGKWRSWEKRAKFSEYYK